LSKRYYALTFFSGRECTDAVCSDLSAIFVSNVIIPGRRPENQPDGLSPTTAREKERERERERSKDKR